ncbi:enoyl-CoA hydratase/isomerase family protein [Pullulanibacillus sp. KACC 23026]|uniref:enoyl-CoA hydratase/isomerase family protein n=1 Tax=Pullulanibacillus sp. KACC 23026 TaxID=3028315 RepID=UPI0023B0D5B2|nr:enoyl-CoA hydratase/isomerase family protein [Pullulanibacillus sp. KACC 23026]WEG14381.1 enoyl-CoA hydratase/isomerase family protein [Pullulanibacillus sp. KACC 23026]
MSEAVIVEVKEHVAWITLNEPESLNALSNEMASGLTEALEHLRKDNEVRAVVLTGNGKAFSAGGNIKGFPKESSPGWLRGYIHDTIGFLKGLAELEKPVIAAVNGFAVGAGLSIALACDMVLAVPHAQFSLGFHKLGLVPDLGALYHLPRVVGMARAKELAFSNRTLTSQEAKDYGIVLEIVEEDGLLTRAGELAEELAQSATLAIGLAKSILNHSFESSLDAIMKEEAAIQALAFASEDHQEGVKAFLTKSKPVFKGR